MKYAKLLFLALAAACTAVAQPNIAAVLNAASYSATVSPGGWVAIFGSDLSSGTLSAQSVPLPLTLAGSSVSVAGMPASLLFVSPNQINALVPIEVPIPANTVVPLAINAASGTSTYNIRLTRDAPGIFSRDATGTGRALLFDPKFQPVDVVGMGDVLILYAAGLGPTDASGHVTDNVEVDIGERPAQVLFAGLAAGFPGIYQLNVVAPVPASDRIYIRSGGWQSNITSTAIRAGQNTTNVNGSIDGLYPTSDPQFPPGGVYRPCTGEDDPGPCGPSGGDPFSIELYAGTFSLSLDVLPGASKFDIAAVGDAGGALITVDPAAGAYTGSITTLAAAARVGDYSAAVRPLWDYVTCDWKTAVCLSFPGNIIPATRINPFWLRGVQMLPQADVAATGTLNTTATISGKLSGAHLSLSNQAFGGILQLGYGPIQTMSANFKLYVDGALVNSKDVSFPVWYRGISRLPDEP